MNTQAWLKLLEEYRAIAVIRADDLTTGKQMAKAIAQGGITLIEITWNSYNPSQLLQELQTELTDCIIGAGTVLTPSALQEAITAGAAFCFSPYCNHQLLKMAQASELPMIPGALSPTEILNAWHSGASSVKVFPITAVGGPKYIHSLQKPLGEVPLIPTGGVTIANAPEFIASGAIAVGLSSSLFPRQLLEKQAWSEITQLARQLRENLNKTNYL